MKFFTYISWFVLFSLSANGLWGQYNIQQPHVHKENKHSNWRVAALIGHTYFPIDHGVHLYIPSFGLDIEYWWSNQWGVGLHNDIEIENFEVVLESLNTVVNRSYPIVSTVDVLYKPWRELVVLIGPGIEADHREIFSLVRFGLEYEWMITDKWDVSPSIFYDTRFDAFDSWSIALGFGRHF